MAKKKKYKDEEASDKTIQSAPNKFVNEGKSDLSKGKGNVDDEEESSNQYDLDEIDEYLAFFSRKFSKMKFKRNPNFSRPSSKFRKDGEQKKIIC